MKPWWNYGSCVATTGVPFLIELNDERVIKLEIEAYYQSGQDACNDSGTPGNTSAMYTWRWAFVG